MQLKLSTVHNVFFLIKKKPHKQESSITSVIFSFSLNNEENEDDSHLKICKKNTEAWNTITYAWSGFYFC